MSYMALIQYYFFLNNADAVVFVVDDDEGNITKSKVHYPIILFSDCLKNVQSNFNKCLTPNAT